MKNLLEIISQILQSIRSSSAKLPANILFIIKQVSFLIDIIKQWIDMNQKKGNGSKKNKLEFN